MKTATIKELAYYLEKAKDDQEPGPIFFLGAGASKTGHIPLASEIVADILKSHSYDPRVEKLASEKQTYPDLMTCLHPSTRNKLLKGYIDRSKINVTHLYLAKLMTEGYVDYILTVNFDNLMLRALALYNEFPATYDMAILKDLTTTPKKKSVVYLHGQHHGLWLLNTQEEMAKVKKIIPPILHSIKNERPWIFIGYSGEDPIFEHIKGLGRFDNGLYWVAYNNQEPCRDVCRALFDKDNTNAFLIKGYDADSFMITLNRDLDLRSPRILTTPFTFQAELLDNIIDIEDKELFRGVKKRLEMAKDNVQKAIQQFEKGKVPSSEKIKADFNGDALTREYIQIIEDGDFQEDRINKLKSKAEQLNEPDIKNLLADLYFVRGNVLGRLAGSKEGAESKDLYNRVFGNYEAAIKIKPDFHEAFYNWGIYLAELASSKDGTELEDLYNQACEKYKAAIKIKPDKHEAFQNWGNALGELAHSKNGAEAERLYNQVFEKIEAALAIKPDNYEVLNNWGKYLAELAHSKNGAEAKKLYELSFAKYEAAIKINPDRHEAMTNWGNTLGCFAGHKKGIAATDLYKQACEKLHQAVALGASSYSLACTYALLGDKENAFLYLKKTLANKEVTADYVLNDKDWAAYVNDEDFLEIIRASQTIKGSLW